MRGLIANDFWLKMLSLALAVLTWLAVSNIFLNKGKGEISPFAQVDNKTFVNVPIMVKLPAEDAREVTVRPTVIEVTVRGDRKLLDNLRSVEAEIDLTGIESARFLQKKIEVHLPPGLVYTRVVPNEVEVIVPPKQ